MDRYATLLARQVSAPAQGSVGVVYGKLAQRLERATLRHDQMSPVGGWLVAVQAAGSERIC